MLNCKKKYGHTLPTPEYCCHILIKTAFFNVSATLLVWSWVPLTQLAMQIWQIAQGGHVVCMGTRQSEHWSKNLNWEPRCSWNNNKKDTRQ